MTDAAPMHLLRLAVEPAWIDYNGHMNVGYYVVAFDRGSDELIDHLGLDADYRARTGCSVYVLETHVCYRRELHLGDEVDVDVQLIDHDHRRLHYFMRMLRARDGEQAASTEIMLMHVDTRTSKGCDLPLHALRAVQALARAHCGLAPPPELGRRIGIRRD